MFVNIAQQVSQHGVHGVKCSFYNFQRQRKLACCALDASITQGSNKLQGVVLR